jgi:hypothetical protein
MINHMLFEVDVLPTLKAILTDARNDWPTNGAALAFFQFAKAA